MTWQPTQDGLRHLVLLQPAERGLPSGDELAEFFGHLQNGAGARNEWGEVKHLRLDINSRERWLIASFQFEFTSWTLIGQITSPDALVNHGGIELLPRAAHREAIGGEIDPAAIRRAWSALSTAIKEIAKVAGGNSGLVEYLPPTTPV